MEFGEKIKARRLELKMTLEELAKLVGVSAPTILRYESGEIKNARRNIIKKLADALDLSPAYLMGWDEQQLKSTAYITEEEKALLDLYNKLDVNDRGEIRGEIKQMLKAPKYHDKLSKNFNSEMA